MTLQVLDALLPSGDLSGVKCTRLMSRPYAVQSQKSPVFIKSYL